jgi:hypothetical protein
MTRMAAEKAIVFDPTDMQLSAWEQIDVGKLQASDLCSPEAVQLLIHIQRVTLTQLKSTKASETRLAQEKGQLQEDREDLRVEVATLQSSIRTTWLEIPMSMLSGFAINILSASPKDGVGWVILVLSLLMLVALRGGKAKAALVNALKNKAR